MHDEIKEDFKSSTLQRQTTMGLVVNLNLIHMVLIGMSSLIQTLIQEQSDEDIQEQERMIKLIHESEEEAKQQLKE